MDDRDDIHDHVSTPDEAPKETHVGQKVFTPDQLNQAGEDKEYFHPKDDRKFNVPEDANNNALTPDIEITPDGTFKPIE